MNLYSKLKEKSSELGISLNKLIKRSLRGEFGLSDPPEKVRDVSFLVCSMSDEVVKEFLKNTEDTRRIDESKWQ